MTSDKKSYGTKLRHYREGLGLDRDTFGARIGVSGVTIKNVELGYQALGKGALKRIQDMEAGKVIELRDNGEECREMQNDTELEQILSLALSQEFQERSRKMAELMECELAHAMMILIKEQKAKKKPGVTYDH